MTTIRRVDGSNERIAALLKWLQLETLPADDPMPTNAGYWWIAYENGNAVAFCGLKRSTRWSDAGYLCRAGVIKHARGKGLQKRLIRVREQQAKKLGWNWLISDTYYNPESANSLISCGFRLFTPSVPWGADDACYWRKKI
jgi:GNAT superfamily N-acetyltransferase